MNIRILIISIILSTGYYFCLYCQQDSTFDSDQNIENIIEESTPDNEDSQLLDNLEYLKENPININSASINDLFRIPFIDIATAEQIIKYVKNTGQVFSVNELFLVKDIDKTSLQKIIPFLTTGTGLPSVNNKPRYPIFNYNNLKINLRTRMINDIQERRGFTENKYQGQKYKIYSRVKLGYGKNIQLGFLSEKDPGEKNLTDFTAYHFSIKDMGIVKNLVIGDFNLNFGQGLALSKPYGVYKGGNVVTSVIKADRDIHPYLNSDENQFFRGVAANLSFSNFGLTAFYSDHKIDGNIDTLSNEITSLVIDGNHRTENEINKYHKIDEKIYGGILNYSIPQNFSLGISFYHSVFNYPFQTSSIYDINGNKFDCLSFSYRINYDNLYFSGEAAWNNSLASINSLQLKISDKISTIISVRNYPKDYFPIHSSGFAESQTKNESGIYTGINFKTLIGNFNFYFDQYKFPWATYYNPLPAKGREFYLNYEVKPLKKLLVSIRFKNEKREMPGDYNENNKTLNQVIQSIKAQFEYNISRYLKTKSRFDYTNFQITGTTTDEKGILIYQNIQLTIFKDISFYFRVMFFQTDSYNSRLYEYESDHPGALSNYVLFGSGLRWYMMTKFEMLDLFLLSLKYSETLKPFEKSIGSGYQEINGNLDNRISLQLDINFQE
jgi:hypothetical protein